MGELNLDKIDRALTQECQYRNNKNNGQDIKKVMDNLEREKIQSAISGSRVTYSRPTLEDNKNIRLKCSKRELVTMSASRSR